MKLPIETSITRTFEAEHSLPSVGVAARHHHAYTVECGYTAHVDPAAGCAMPLQALAAEVDAVIDPLRDSYLNDLLPVPPTAEMLGCWILLRLPAHWQWIVVAAYDGYRCRIERRDVEPWLATLRS